MINLRKTVLLLAIPGALALPAPAHAGSWTSTTNAVAVYQYNVHQYYDDWIGWIDDVLADPQAPIPDVITGQDFESPVKVIDFKNQLSSLGWTYGYAYSENPDAADPNKPNAKGTTRAVFWRTARFSLLAQEQWFGQGGQVPADCQGTGENNAHAIQVRLDDLTSNRTVGVVSMKTPPMGNDNDCTWQNMQIATQKLTRSAWAADLYLIGTDTNSPDWGGAAYNCWYKGTTLPAGTGQTCGDQDLGWSDAIYDLCAGGRTCLDGHWTHSKDGGPPFTRIDYILARRASTPGAVFASQATIDKGVCSTYSDHCSVRALVSYGTTF